MRRSGDAVPALAAVLAAALFASRAESYRAGRAASLRMIRGRIQTMHSLLDRTRSHGSALPADRLADMRDLLNLAEEAEPWAQKLVLLEARYPAMPTLGELDLERAEPRKRLESALRRFRKRLNSFKNETDPNNPFLMARRMISNPNAASRPQLALLGDFYYAARDIDFPMASADVDGLDYILQRDKELYEGARPVIERRRLLRRLATFAAFLLPALAWAARRRGADPRDAPDAPNAAARGAGRAPGPAAGENAPAEVLGGNFRITRELGRGGMGLVYEALDLTLRRKVAVKRMREDLCRSPADLEMFLEEARLVASLQHPNIVEIHSLLRENGRVYLVFEYVAGRPLHRELEERGRLPLRAVLDILRPVAEAVDYAHSRRIIHRDLKPSNIMLTERREVKVMDFGLAHQAKVTVARLTRASAWGTLAYMAPEQELGSVSKESDLYSLGVCLYEMAAGAPPFPGPDYLAQKRARRYAPPSARGLPAGLDGVLERALAAEPEGRFHSAAELLAAAEAASATREGT